MSQQFPSSSPPQSRRCVAAFVLGVIAALSGCAAPYDVPTGGSRDTSSDDEPIESSDTPTGKANLRQAQPQPPGNAAVATPLLTASFRETGNLQKDTYDRRGRVCSHNATANSRASFIDATKISLVAVNAPAVVVGELDASTPVSQGVPLGQVKMSFAETGVISLPVNPSALTAEDRLYAIVGSGSNFGDPSTCRDLTNSREDAERFPSGCGVLGYVVARYDASSKTVIAEARSQFIWGSNPREEKRSKFGSPMEGCDDYDSPLVLDLSARGITLGEPTDGVFDVDGDGTADRLAWVTSTDTPFLVRDANENGVVDGIDEMFGNQTRSSLGLRSSANGFEALAAWDADGNGKIDASDAVWTTLRLWFDRNHDGKTDAGELESLTGRGIRSLSVGYVDVDAPLFFGGASVGAVRQRGGATGDDGRIVPVVDVWFRRHR